MSLSIKTQEATARRAARRVGLVVRKSRWHVGTIENRGGFMLLDPYRNVVIDGERFDLDAAAVIEFCNRRR